VKRAEIDALVRAHRGRARPVAFLHVLRQPTLEEDDHVFLREHDRELTVVDLLRWRARCAPGFTAAPIRALARVALDEPAQFEHELLDAPGFSLADEEWIELSDLLRGKIPAALLQRITDRGQGRPLPVTEALPPLEADPFAGLFTDIEAGPPPAPAPPIDAALAPEAVLERAKNAFSADERAALLVWLASRDVPRKTLLPIAFSAVRAGELSRELCAFIAASLGSRAAWEAHGLDCFLAFLDRGALAELSDLCADAYSRARGTPEADERTEGNVARGLLSAMHAAFAGGLVATAHEALAAEQHPRALLSLAALTCLDPPSRLSRAVHDLRRVAGSDGDVRELVELNQRLIKHGRGREASFEGLVAAIHTLADAL
jgi:hypothetical protein